MSLLQGDGITDETTLNERLEVRDMTADEPAKITGQRVLDEMTKKH